MTDRSGQPGETLAERWLARWRKNRLIAVIGLFVSGVVYVANFTDGFEKISQAASNLFGQRHDSSLNPLWLSLSDDLRELDKKVHDVAVLADIRGVPPEQAQPDRVAKVVSDSIGQAEEAAKPVCGARERISELGDTDTRQALDVICADVVMLRRIANDGRPLDAADAAAKIERDDPMEKLRVTLRSRT